MKRYKAARYAAVDLGAESGRVVAGDFDGDRLSLEVVHRFANAPAHLPDGIHWNVVGLFAELLAGLRRAGVISSVGIDAWGCDYGLLDGAGQLLGLPYHYRDARTVSTPEQAFASVSRSELYGRTGIQHLRFNTAFQLLADAEAGLDLMRAERIALIPDLLTCWLTGVLVNEATVASTTGLVDAASRGWAVDLIQRMGLPVAPFTSDLVEPGIAVGQVSARHGLASEPLVRAVAAHDTASAFAAVPFASMNAAVISCGTWSLVGMELDEPHLGAAAAVANLSNEWGIDGTIRLLRNVMGLWLLQECRREWERRGEKIDYQELQLQAACLDDEDVPLFDPDLDLFLEPGDMPARIAAVCLQTGQARPETPAEFARSILLSLGCKYRLVLEELTRVTGRVVDIVHIVGGGARNEPLCRLAADIIGVPVRAGPVEATAIGNILVQARAAGAFASREEMRRCVDQSFAPIAYDPNGESPSPVYERFLALTRAGERVHTRS